MSYHPCSWFMTLKHLNYVGWVACLKRQIGHYTMIKKNGYFTLDISKHRHRISLKEEIHKIVPIFIELLFIVGKGIAKKKECTTKKKIC